MFSTVRLTVQSKVFSIRKAPSIQPTSYKKASLMNELNISCITTYSGM